VGKINPLKAISSKQYVIIKFEHHRKHITSPVIMPFGGIIAVYYGNLPNTDTLCAQNATEC
jgi:hypothetical protein